MGDFMKVIEIDTNNRAQVKTFLDLPFQIYRKVLQWVPPLDFDARRMLDRRRHPFYRHSQAAFLLAMQDDGYPLGRIAVLDNRNYNEYNHEQTAFFYLFECEHDRDTAQALFEASFAWARRRGLNKMFGPKGFTALDGMGLLVKGFEHRPALSIPYNRDYYPTLLEAAGFEKESDVLSGYLGSPTQFPEKIHEIAELVQKRRGLHIARFRRRSDLRRLIPNLKELYNASLGGTTGSAPITDDEVRLMADQLLWFADPSLVKVVMKDDRMVGFLLAYPDISAAIQRHKGRLFPFGWLDALLELRRSPYLDINGAGMIEGFRGVGGTAILFSEMCKSILERNPQHVEVVQIGADNDRMLRELRDLGVDFYKVHRMYQRAL
jgi:hypothetical protein